MIDQLKDKAKYIFDGMFRLLEKLEVIAKEQEWPELEDMIINQAFKDVNESTQADQLFNQEQFLMRLCLRYEHFKKAPLNVVSLNDRNERFVIRNYDYNTFLWAKKVVPEYIDNNFIYVPYDRLSKAQYEAFKSKAVNNYE